jgi:hypothetical protein
MVALGVGLIPTIAFTLHDLVFQLPDNQHEASLGFFLTIFGLFGSGSPGYLAAQGSRVSSRPLAREPPPRRPAWPFWLTFITLNHLFADRMSYRRIGSVRSERVVSQPCAHTWTINLGPGPFPVMCVAALAGVAGGAIGRKPQRIAA